MQLTQDIQLEHEETVTMRPAIWGDLTAVLDLCNACSIAEIGRPDMSETRLRAEWESPRFELDRNTRVVTTADNRIVGYLEVWDTEPLPVNNWVWARTHPEFEGRGIGTLMMDWVDQRLQETVARVPSDLQVVYHSGAINTNQTARTFLEHRGMKHVRSFWNVKVVCRTP